MAIGWSIQDILSTGTVAGITTNIYYGKLPQQGDEKGLAIDDFSTGEPCKDGEAGEDYTVTLIAWGVTRADCESIVDAAKVDLIQYKNTVQGLSIIDIRFNGRGPWLFDKDTRKHGRPADFRVIT